MTNGRIRVSRRWVVACLLAGAADRAFGLPLNHSPRPELRPAGPVAAGADALIEAARLGGKIGFVVADARTGAVLEARNPILRLPPASTAKAVTTLYALAKLPPDYRFQTRVLATGPVRGGRVEGDLVLAGTGDPVLDTDTLAGLAARLKAAGVREVAGKFRYFAGALPHLKVIDPEQPDHVSYNPAVSGLNLNFNRVLFEWHRASAGWDVTMDARSNSYRPRVGMSRMRVVNRQSPIYTYDDRAGTDDWTVASAVLGNGGSRWLPVRKPALYAAEVFQTLARSHGIVLPAPVAAPALPQGTVVVAHDSPALRELLADMLKYSTNMTAEVIGMTATYAAGGHPVSLSGSAAAMNDWLDETLGIRRARFVDHSGLGSGSRIAPADMVKLLVAAGPDGPLRPLMKPVWLRDAKGRPVKDHPVRIRAKTGTLNFASALTGYVTTADGRELAFATFMADEERRAKLDRASRERPEGGRSWATRARTLQLQLIERWATLYGA